MHNVNGVEVLKPPTYVHTQLLGGMRQERDFINMEELEGREWAVEGGGREQREQRDKWGDINI